MYQIMEDDKIMVAGRFSPDTTNLEDRRHLVRIHSDGSPDLSFEPLKCHEPFHARINNLYPTPDGKWMITGEFLDIEGFESPGIARLNADFSVDTTFLSPFPDYNWEVRIIPGSHPQQLSGAIDEQNRVYVKFIDPDLGFPSPLLGLDHKRLLPDGSIDSTFQLGELTFLYYYGEGEYYPGSIYTMAFEPDGSLIIGGRFRTIEGQPRGNIAKLNEDGSLIEDVFQRQGADTANWQNGTNPTIEEPHISRIVRLENGGLMVGGCFSRYDGHDQWGLVRLLQSPVGIDENNMNTISVACFPNPAADFVHFSIEDLSLTATAEIKIYDTSGRQVWSHSNYLLQQPLIISALGTGLYNVVIRFEDKQIATTRFVKTE